MVFQVGEVFSKGKIVDLVLFLRPYEARDRELILVVHSLSNRAMKRLELLIPFSSLLRSAEHLTTRAQRLILCPSLRAREGIPISNRDSWLNPHSSLTASTKSSNFDVSIKLCNVASFSWLLARRTIRSLASWRICCDT